uniref:HAMP domain-containing histidine kinase n=1 Tax=Archaeoglobus fulgidus TaxID=2234 RepID=A0A7J3M0I0_ARCFL
MLGKFIIIMIVLGLPIALLYLVDGMLPINVPLYVSFYILVISSLSLIFSLFLVAIWTGERRLFASFTALTIFIGIVGICTAFSEGFNISGYEEMVLDFVRKISGSELAFLSFLSLHFPLLSFGIWKAGREIVFLRFRDLIVSVAVLIFSGIAIVVANLYSTTEPQIKELFNVMSFADILLIFLYTLLVQIYRETEARAYYLVILGFFSLKFLCDIAIVGSVTTAGIPVVFYALSHVNLFAGMVYLYTRDVRILTYQEIVEEKERVMELYKRVNELQEALSIINRMLRHDVKNKLQIILGYIEIYLAEKDEHYLEKAIQAVEETNQYLNKIRDLERAISTEKSILKPTNIREVVEKVLNFYQIPSNVQGNCYALADEAIYSVIDNIVNNAIKHGKTDRIDVKLSELDGECEIRIIDYGVGIPSEIKRKIFEEKFTLDPKSGSGLGLYVVRKVVERYGGRVWVEDTKPRGATFVLRLKARLQ